MPDSPLSQRLVSLNAFRGLTIAAMILVNNPGSWGNIYPPLTYAVTYLLLWWVLIALLYRRKIFIKI